MIHARDDYNRIQDPYGLIGITEPVFLLRAKDKHTPNTIRHWVKLNQESGNTDPLVNIAATWAEVMENWQKEHGCKLPDITTNSNSVMTKFITILRPDGTISNVRNTVNEFEEPLTEHEQIINELYYMINQLKINLTDYPKCDSCGCHPNIIYTTSKGRFCESCKPKN